MTYDEYKDKRSELFRTSERSKMYKRNNVIQSQCFCSMCGKNLTNLVLATGKKTAKHSFKRLTMNELLYFNLCDSSYDCYKEYLERR